MPVYVYETLPTDPGEPPRRFEVRQSMADAPLQQDPESGHPVRRVIQGGYLNTHRWTQGTPTSPQPPASTGGHCCGVAGCGPH